MDIIREAVEEFFVGAGTVGTTASKLHTGKAIAKGVVVRAGAKVLAIGNYSGVTYATGYQLAAGEQSPVIHIDDLSKVWVVGNAAGSDYTWIAE